MTGTDLIIPLTLPILYPPRIQFWSAYVQLGGRRIVFVITCLGASTVLIRHWIHHNARIRRQSYWQQYWHNQITNTHGLAYIRTYLEILRLTHDTPLATITQLLPAQGYTPEEQTTILKTIHQPTPERIKNAEAILRTHHEKIIALIDKITIGER